MQVLAIGGQPDDVGDKGDVAGSSPHPHDSVGPDRHGAQKRAEAGGHTLREFSSPSTYTLPRNGNLTDDVVDYGTKHPDSVVFSVRDGGSWSEITAADFLAQVRAVANGLVAAGIQSGDRVGLLS